MSWLRRAARSWVLAPLVTTLVASLLVAAPSGAGAVSDGQSEAPGSSSAPSTIQAEPLPSLTTPQPGSSFDLSSFDLSSGGIPLEQVPPPAEAAKATRTQAVVADAGSGPGADAAVRGGDPLLHGVGGPGSPSHTVAARPADSRARVVVTPPDDDNDDDHQVALDVGEMTVTAEDGATTGVYTATVARNVDVTRAAAASMVGVHSATVDGTSVVLSYSQDLDESSEPAAGVFAVKVTDSAVDDAAAETVVVDTVVVASAEVTLTLAAPVRHDDTVTVTYTPNVVVPLQDTAGNDATAFDAAMVTNDTVAAADTKLSSLTLTAGSELLTLTPVFAAGTRSYTAFVPNETTRVTVTAAAADSRARVVVTPGVDNNDGNGHQVALEAGANVVSVTVTAEDAITTGVYTVTVNRGAVGDPPRLVSATVDSADLVLVYYEDLDETSEAAPADYTVSVTKKGGAMPATTVIGVVVDDRSVTLTLSEPVIHDDEVAVSYTPGTKGIVNIGNIKGLAFADYAVRNITGQMAPPPQLVSASVNGMTLVLVYNEPLNALSRPAPVAFVVWQTDGLSGIQSKLTATNVAVVGSSVTLTLSETVTLGDTVTVSYTPGAPPIRSSRGSDAAALNRHAVENRSSSTGLELFALSLSDVGLSPRFVSTTRGYTATVDNPVSATTVTADPRNPFATVDVQPEDSDARTRGHQVPLVVGSNNIEISVSIGIAAVIYTVTVTRSDPVAGAPRLSSATADGAELVLAYNEALDATSQPAADAFAVVVTDSETGLTSVPAVDDVSIAGSEVTLTLAAAVRHGDSVTLSYTPGTGPIRDLTNQAAERLINFAVANDTAAAGNTALSALQLRQSLGSLEDNSGLQLELSPVFSPDTTGYSALVAYEVDVVSVNAVPADRRASLEVTPVGDNYGLLGAQRVSLDVGLNTVTVVVTAEDGTTADYTVAVTRANETTPPELGSATVDGSRVALSYNENLDEDSAPTGAEFAVRVTDSFDDTMSTPTVEGVSVNGSEVFLTLSAAVRHADVVTVDYTAGTDPIRDAVGNDAVAFTGLGVTNMTAAAADARLVRVQMPPAGRVLLVPPGILVRFAAHTVEVVTVNATLADERAMVTVSTPDADGEAPGEQVSLLVGLINVITLTVTAEDRVTTATYRVNVFRAGPSGVITLYHGTVDGSSVVLVLQRGPRHHFGTRRRRLRGDVDRRVKPRTVSADGHQRVDRRRRGDLDPVGRGQAQRHGAAGLHPGPQPDSLHRRDQKIRS